MRGGIRMAASGTEEFELKQMKDMAAARKRWETLVCLVFSLLCFSFSFCLGCVIDSLVLFIT